MTFENVKMRGQRKAAIMNFNNVITMRNIDFEGDTPFYTASGGKSVIALLDSTISYTGKDKIAAMTASGVSAAKSMPFGMHCRIRPLVDRLWSPAPFGGIDQSGIKPQICRDF